MFIVFVVAAAAYGGYVLVTLPQLRVSKVDVHIDGLAVSERSVLDAAAIDRGSNVWLLHTAAIVRRIEAIPYVERARIIRTPPAQLAIAVSEREPFACVAERTRVVTVDRSERILQDGCARSSAIRIALRDAPLGSPGSFANSAELAALIEDAQTLGEAHVAVQSLAKDRFGQLVATDETGLELLFGSDGDLHEKSKLVAPVLAATHPGHAIRRIDLRAPATPTVEYR